jgi:hypothetical protein
LPLSLPVLGLTTLCTQGTESSGCSHGFLAADTGPSSSSAAPVLAQLQELRLFDCQLDLQLLTQLLSAAALSKLQWQHVQLFRDNWEWELTSGELYATLWQQLALLPKLSELYHYEGRLTIADIAPLSTLQHLQRLHVRRLDYCSAESDPRALLAALQHLTQLQHLELDRCWQHFAEPEPQQQGDINQCFSALTASTQLTALVVWGDYEPVPQAAFEHLFPAGRVLPSLRMLQLCSQDHKHCVEAAQVAMIAASCPALQELCLCGVIAKGFDVSCLSQLPPGVTSIPGVGWCRPKLNGVGECAW